MTTGGQIPIEKHYRSLSGSYEGFPWKIMVCLHFLRKNAVYTAPKLHSHVAKLGEITVKLQCACSVIGSVLVQCALKLHSSAAWDPVYKPHYVACGGTGIFWGRQRGDQFFQLVKGGGPGFSEGPWVHCRSHCKRTAAAVYMRGTTYKFAKSYHVHLTLG